MKQVAVLFARQDSIYKAMEGCDVWDIERDARKWPGGAPVVGHPPCRAWGGLRHFAKPRPDEKKLATWCVGMLRKWGGVLEHPAGSTLWPTCNLPEPGLKDGWGGFTIIVPQFWWGHLAEKNTRFYIVGCKPRSLPEIPLVLGEPTHSIGHKNYSTHRDVIKPGEKKELLKSAREKTPPALARWLVELARRCEAPKK